jgi:hypothetical protein
MRTNSRYLALALDIRKLSDSLILLAEDNVESPYLFEAINRLLLSLQGADQKTSVKALRDRGTFGQYENVVMVNEVIPAPGRTELIQKLQAVLHSDSQDLRKENALQAIAFFDSLERRALYHFNHPKVTTAMRATA